MKQGMNLHPEIKYVFVEIHCKNYATVMFNNHHNTQNCIVCITNRGDIGTRWVVLTM